MSQCLLVSPGIVTSTMYAQVKQTALENGSVLFSYKQTPKAWNTHFCQHLWQKSLIPGCSWRTTLRLFPSLIGLEIRWELIWGVLIWGSAIIKAERVVRGHLTRLSSENAHCLMQIHLFVGINLPWLRRDSLWIWLDMTELLLSVWVCGGTKISTVSQQPRCRKGGTPRWRTYGTLMPNTNFSYLSTFCQW